MTTAECILGHKWTMTEAQIADAQSFGCVMCPTCGNPATVTGAAATLAHSPRKTAQRVATVKAKAKYRK